MAKGTRIYRTHLTPWERKLLEQLPVVLELVSWPCEHTRDRLRLLERVQALGWVQKVQDPSSSHGWRLELTEEGAKVIRRKLRIPKEEPPAEAPPVKKRGRKK